MIMNVIPLRRSSRRCVFEIYLQTQFDIGTFHLKVIKSQFHCRIEGACSCSQIKSKSMPRTRNGVVFHFAFTDWSSAMRTNILKSVIAAVDVPDCDLISVHFHNMSLAWGDV